MHIKKRPYWITFGLIFIVAVILALVFIPGKKQKEINVGLLTTESSMTKEVDSIRHYMDKYSFLKYEEINVQNIKKNQLDKFDVIWYQQIDSTDLPGNITNEAIIDDIQNYISRGGNLLLTMDGFKFLDKLGVESSSLATGVVEAKDRGFGRKRGLHAYKHHPVFKGLNGGAYMFSPMMDTTTRHIGYFNETVPEKGKVIATDWAYITMDEDRKLMMEYEVGKGKIIGIGAYTTFHIPNFHKVHLEKFMNNVFAYLTGNIKDDTYYWDYSPNKITNLKVQTDKINPRKNQKWEELQWGLKFEHKPTPNFWDVAGERMLIMGNEKSGIEEIWAHPFMALRDYEIGYRLDEQDKIKWISDENREVKITPNAFERNYAIGDNTLKEIITTDIKEPVCVIHYEYTGEKPVQLFVKYDTRMRLMWPYSSKVTGEIKHTWSEDLNAFIFTDRTEDLVTVTGISQKPDIQKSGQFSDFSVSKDKVITEPTDEFKGSAFTGFKIEPGEATDIIIAATNEGVEKTVSVYKNYTKKTGKVFRESGKYYSSLLDSKLQIKTPEEEFNEAYKWALIGTDRFFVNTPGLGKSLMAGYATTARGWNGGHEINGRPGYAWYFGRDAQWSGFAVDGYGDFNKVRSILEIFIKYQDLNGKIFHELTSSGAVHYDAADATPLFIVLAGHYLKHSGDKKFIKDNWQSIEKAIDFCFSTDRNGDHLIENTLVGHGWVEGGHLFGGRSTLYLSGCWAAALEEAAMMAKTLNKNEDAEYYQKESDTVKDIINTTFWNEKEQFFYHSINDDNSFIEDITVMPAIPLYFKQIREDKQKPVLERFAANNFSSDWGMRIATMENEHFNPHGYHTGSVWPLYTGWTALAEYKNNRPAQGFTHAMNNLWIYKNWSKGYVEEVMNGLEYKPSGVCPHQCWSETMALQPLYEGMLGYKPNATENKMQISPALPAHWKKTEFTNIRMGDHTLDISMKKTDRGTSYIFEKSGSGEIYIDFNPYLPVGTVIESITVNDSKADFTSEAGKDYIRPKINFKLKKKIKVNIEHNKGIAALPVIYKPEPGDQSNGIRIINSKLEKNTYIIEAEGPAGSEKKLKLWIDGKVVSTTGADIIKEEYPVVTLNVNFEQRKISGTKGEYQKKKIKIKLKK